MLPTEAPGIHADVALLAPTDEAVGSEAGYGSDTRLFLVNHQYVKTNKIPFTRAFERTRSL